MPLTTTIWTASRHCSTDHQGTVRDLAKYNDTTSTTDVVSHREIDAYGNILEETGPTTGSTPVHVSLFTYTGREWDGDVDLYYYRARWYAADAGKFISNDPIGFAAGDTNITRYVGNSVPNATDPPGLKDPFADSLHAQSAINLAKKREARLKEVLNLRLPEDNRIRVEDELLRISIFRRRREAQIREETGLNRMINITAP